MFCSISSWSSGCCEGKNKSRGNTQIAARLTSLFSSLPRYITGKFSSSVRRNPWISELLLRHPFKSGSVLLLRLHFKEVPVNRLRRQPGTKQSLIFRHNSAVSSPPQSLSAPVPLRGRAPVSSAASGIAAGQRPEPCCPARGHLHPPNPPQVPRFCFHDSAGAALTAPSPPVCSPRRGSCCSAPLRARSGGKLGLMDVCVQPLMKVLQRGEGLLLSSRKSCQ